MGAIVSHGIDISNWQTYVDHAAIAAAGYVLLIAKATEGTTYRDPYFPRNWAETVAAGMQRGAYAFGRPSRGAPEPDARVFCDYVLGQGPLAAGDVLVLDMEDTEAHGDLAPWCLDWLGYVEGRTGCRPWLYSGAWFMQPHGLWSNAELGAYPLWYASYTARPPHQMCPSPPAWGHVTLWQYSSTGTVPGVSGDCDLNCSDLSAAQLVAAGYAPAPSGPPPPREPLDALWASEQACEPVYTSPADAEDLAGTRAHITAIKNRHGYP